jgi:diguanylate cyclase (GGDEF)-like protein
MTRYRFVYALVGTVLGIAGPLGAFFLRLILFYDGDLYALKTDYDTFAFFYDYMAVGATLSFTIFGYLLGTKIDYTLSQEKKFYELSIRDPLTGIYNRRHVEKCLEAEFKRANRFHYHLSCLLFDIDHFKGINDTYGHHFGDKVLKTLASTVESRIREYDIFGRYGGEEFILILPQTLPEEAYRIAETLRQEIALQSIELSGTQVGSRRGTTTPKSVQITISIGVCSSALHPHLDKEELIKHADFAMYHAKEEGRNQTQKCQRNP